MLRKLLTVAALACALPLAACAAQPDKPADSEQLRARVERLEREDAAERAKLEAEIAAMRQELRDLRTSLDEATRGLAATGPEAGQKPEAAAPAEKSPRQALREHLRSMLDSTRNALERLTRELDQKLGQPPKPETPARQAQPPS